MPKKLSPSADKSPAVSETDPAAESSLPEEQLTVGVVTNTETNPQTQGVSPLTTPLTDAISWPTIGGKTKAVPAQKSWAAVASGGAASTSGQPQAQKASWAAIASGSIASTSRAEVFASTLKASEGAMVLSSMPSTSSQIQLPRKSWPSSVSGEVTSASAQTQAPKAPWASMTSGGVASTSKAPAPFITESQKRKTVELFNELEQLNPNDRNHFKKITIVIYKIRDLKINLNANDKLRLIDFVSSLDLKPWTNMNFVHLFISLKYSGIFDNKIPQDTEGKQAKLFKQLIEITEKVIHDPRSYHRSEVHSFLFQVIRLIATSSSLLIDPNKKIISRSLKAFIGYIEEKGAPKPNAENIYKLTNSIYDLSTKDVITQEEAIELARPYFTHYDDIVEGLKNLRQQNSYLFACRRFMTSDHGHENYKNKVEAIYNKSINLIDPLSSDIHGPFYLFDEIHYATNIRLIDIENCNLETLMKMMEGKVHTLIGKPLFAKLYINLYNLETTTFSQTNVYKRLRKEFLTCLNKNMHKIDPASIARIEAFMAKSKVSYVNTDELDTSITDNLELMLGKICSEHSMLSKENCLASLDIFSHKMPTNIHMRHFEYFKHRIIPVLLSQYAQLTYNEKIKLVRVLPLTRSERNDQICKQVIDELYNAFITNPEEYKAESVLFLNAMTKLGSYNSNIIPFVELSRKILVVDETCSKSDLFRRLKFYSFAYAYFILQEQESAQPQKAVNSLKEEMKEKIALTMDILESQYKGHLFNDDLLMLNYAYALLKINKHHDIKFAYSETNIQREIYESLAREYELEKGEDIQLEASLFGLPGIDIYLNKYKLALEIDGKQHYQGADYNSVSGKSLIQKAILNMNGIHLINITKLTRRRSLVLEDVKQQINDFLRHKEADSSD